MRDKEEPKQIEMSAPESDPGPTDLVPAKTDTNSHISKGTLTPTQFGALADVPPEFEWVANLTNAKTRHAFRERGSGAPRQT